MRQKHRLDAIDEVARTAECEQCGAVDVYPNGIKGGKQQWRCGPAARALQRSLLEKRNPNARRNKGRST